MNAREPGRWRGRLGNLRMAAGCVAGLRGIVQFARVLRLARSDSAGTEAEPIPVPMKAIGGDPLLIRPGTSDLYNAISYYSARLELPPAETRDAPIRRIVELGTNIGAALTALAHSFPDAVLLGVEPDPLNVAVARANTGSYGPRCEVVEGAIWDRSEQLVLDRSREAEHSAHGVVVRAEEPGDSEELPRLTGLSLDDLLDERMPGEVVDYMHVSIEGGEERLFGAGGRWPGRVRSMKVELHPYFGFTAAVCADQLATLGYVTRLDEDLPDKWMIAVRRS